MVPSRFLAYLRSIGMTEKAFLQRTDETLIMMRKFVRPQPIRDILVEEVVQQDGTRQYLHLAAFTTDYVASANNYLVSDHASIGVSPLSLGIAHFHAETTSFDFSTATAESRIFINFALGSPGASAWTLQGSGSNCAHIWRLAEKYILPRL